MAKVGFAFQRQQTYGGSFKIDRSEITWDPPPMNQLKLNFDGSLKGNLGESGAGFVLRDHRGFLINAKTKKLPVGMNNQEETQALLYGLQMALELEIKVLLIEGHSLWIINACREIFLCNWKISYVMNKIWGLLKHFNSFQSNDVYREANQVADYLANIPIGHNVSESIFTHEDVNLPP
ncbi:hypothetical protein SUGI_0828500 [Cryptomeria japonica]|nr:hypothetical protein SUGI_0828500 [Cryptomeria japonica]